MKNITPQIILALITTFGLFFCIFFLLKWSFPPEIKDQLGVFTQLLGTIWTLQMNFFFGSTSSSKAKDEVIGDIAKAPANGAISIPNADSVSVKTESGDVTVASKPNEPIMPLKEELNP